MSSGLLVSAGSICSDLVGWNLLRKEGLGYRLISERWPDQNCTYLISFLAEGRRRIVRDAGRFGDVEELIESL